MISNDLELYRKDVIILLAKALDCPVDEKILNKSHPSWDSLKQLQISLELEDRFDIEFSDEQANEFFDADSILHLLAELIIDEK